MDQPNLGTSGMKHVGSVINHTGFDEAASAYGEWLRPSSTIKLARREVTRRILAGQPWAWVGLSNPAADFLRIIVQARGGRQIESWIEYGDSRRLYQLKELSEE